jgi:dolichol kinase
MAEFFYWFILISIAYFLVLFLYMHFSYKKEVFNNFFGFGALFLTFISVIIIELLMFQDITLYSVTIPIFTLALGLPLLIISAIVLISSVILFLFKLIFKNKDFSKFWNSLEEKTSKRSKLRGDTYRKIPHVLIFVGLFVVWYLGVDFVMNLSGSISGMIPDDNNMFSLFIQIIFEPNSISEVLFSLGWFYYLLFFFFYGFCFIILANELTRKVRIFAFPFNFLSNILLSEEEKKGYGTYLYFAIGQMVAALLTPPMVFLTILGISSIADLATSQIGIRFGKTKIRWNKEKSWEGSIAGIIACFIICFFFIGIPWAVIFTFAFLLFDIFTNKPIDISDNLLIPIGSSLIYLFIRFFCNFDYYTIIMTWI